MDTALLIIDVQQAFFSAHPEPLHAESVIARINDLSRRARAAGATVIIFQHEESEGAPQFGTLGWNLDERLQVRPADVRIRKTTPDSFHQTELLRRLEERAIRHVMICGYATEFCVDSTVRRALSLGFDVTLVEDGHTTEDKPHLKASDIIQHHNITLSGLTNVGVNMIVRPAASLWPPV